ncbi:MAG: DUF58 domain-containing protein [Firmicutes bacterium]|nr:DUF58 domain-containing protein [Bacillota bacterium]
MERINNIVYYAVVCLILFGMFLFYRNVTCAVMFGVMLIYPLVSLIACCIAYIGIGAEVKSERECMDKGEENRFFVIIKNYSFIPILSARISIEMNNLFYREDSTRIINTSIGVLKETLVIPIVSDVYGKIDTQVTRIEISDWLNFFKIKKDMNEEEHIYVLPAKNDEMKSNGDNISGNAAGQENEKIGDGFDVVNIREYEEGDKLRSIHWKTSARLNEIYVKENNDEENDVTIVLFELFKEKKELNSIIERTYDVCRALVKENISFILCCNNGEHDISSYMIYSNEDIDDAMRIFTENRLSEYKKSAYENYMNSARGGNIIYIGVDETLQEVRK